MAVCLFLLFPDQDDRFWRDDLEQQDVDYIMQTVMAVGTDILQSSESITFFYDNRNIEIFLETIDTLYEPEYLRMPRNILQQKLQGIGVNWRGRRLHVPDCNYVLWNYENFMVSPVLDTTLAEMTERILTYPEHQYLLLNISKNPINRKCLPVFKDLLHDDAFPRFAHIHVVTDQNEWRLWWNFYREKSEQTQFSLLDKNHFRKTSFVQQGKPVYQEIATELFWYLDNFHKNEYEVFDKQGRHLGVSDLDGNLDETKKVKGRTITVN